MFIVFKALFIATFI